MTRRVLVCGGRDYSDEGQVFAILDAEHELCPIGLLIQGGAKGADWLAWRWASLRNVPSKTYIADWKTHGKAAGPIRNAGMLRDGQPTVVIAFSGGKGTRNMVSLARKSGVRVIKVGD